jgi:Zn-dependent peptidase ImmA (M78 family)
VGPTGYMAIARINGGIIAWARRRSGATIEAISTQKITPETIRSWEEGKSFPSEGQAEELAKRLGVAYALLYLPEIPPDEKPTLPDLRTVDGRPISNPSLNFLKVLDTTIARQEWYREELSATGARPLPFVSKFRLTDPPSHIARDMRSALGFGEDLYQQSTGFEDFLSLLIDQAESAGVLVMRSALVGHATSRKLSEKEFRGFVLLDKLAPIIFINDSDAEAAQIFTFAHELAHIWIGAAGISDRKPTEKGSSSNSIEVACDRIAAEFLAPTGAFAAAWSADRPVDSNVSFASRRFRVSSLVALRRAKDLQLISPDIFFRKVEQAYEAYKKREEKRREEEKKKNKKGGNFWASFELRNSARFNSTVVESIQSQRTTYAEAGALFSVTPLSAARYVRRRLGIK